MKEKTFRLNPYSYNRACGGGFRAKREISVSDRKLYNYWLQYEDFDGDEVVGVHSSKIGKEVFDGLLKQARVNFEMMQSLIDRNDKGMSP